MTLCMIRLFWELITGSVKLLSIDYADQKGIDAFANWLGDATQSVSASLRKIQNGFVRSYALSVMLGVVLILGYLIFEVVESLLCRLPLTIS